MSKVKELLNKINLDFSKVNVSQDSTNYWNLSTDFQALDNELREQIQEQTVDQIAGVMVKIRDHQELSSSDLDFLKLWLVGDAEQYIKYENNFQDWVEELKRLVSEINDQESLEADYKTAAKTRALILDAIRVLGDIVFYVKQKERLKNFSDSTKEIDLEEREIILRLLEGKGRSPNV